ncbi:hypothetical protein F5B22DRAFT_591412 [Xylaria bambusicola]|uniref:uncharacterized protein n=1 Tax=Xylaria bambusicola TaxID=326684 RepID=UPI0020083340|nr:uncharacterized protein F5B22DRAFT_591412 [Xylaria bambusicola]KAI0523650.1 hypothetical protein F5B22DRAFT_591412 [Xylaria bambusicola]
MAMWPFRRRGTRRRSNTAHSADPTVGAPGDGHQLHSVVSTTPNASDSGKGNRIPQRRGRAYSFSPGRQDSLRVNKLRKKSSVQAHQSLPAADISQRMPTLYHDTSRNKRRGQPLLHKKSSKRRKEDHDREVEIRAMSQFMPARPATDHWIIGRPSKRESRQLRSGLGGAVNQRSSDISLPGPESIHSAMSSDSEQISWKVSAFDALSPRPTLRYSSNPFTSSAAGSGPARSQSTKKKASRPITIPESTLCAHHRIHDLADDLDASDLRELMERDKRRRQRKAEKERDRAQRRLARRSEKQRAEEAVAAENGSPPPGNLERGVLGREMPDLAGDRTSAVVTSSRRRSSSDSPRRRSKQSSDMEHLETRAKTPSPLNEFYRTDSIPPPEPSPPAPDAGSDISMKQAESIAPRSSSPKFFGFIRSRKSHSTSPRQSEDPIATTVQSPPTASIKLDDAESVSRTSDSRSSRPWLSLFRWGKNRRSSGPSSFSNTSRDSMLGTQTTPPANYLPPRIANTGVPKRTMSRFREDLPELPISPPDSRVASPEVEHVPAEPLPAIPDDVAVRYDTPMDSHKYQETMRATPISIHRDEVQPSPALQSMSLASVDSEGSWLSGRISRKRTSQYPPRTVSALSGRSECQTSEQTEDDNIVDDEYLNSVVPSRLHRLSTGEARPSSDEDEDSAPKWGAVGQVPTVVQHSDTMRSREGVLQSFGDDKEFGNIDESEDDGDGQSPVEPQRATSISLSKGHFRNFSAGSAKLLEISPRQSGDHRMST